MELKLTSTKYLTYSQIITLAKQAGVDFGKGYPYNRLRYYTKFGLLPKAERKSFGGNPEGCYPEWVVDKLIEVDRKIKDGRSIQSILREQKHRSTAKEETIKPTPIVLTQTPTLPEDSPRDENRPRTHLKTSFAYLGLILIILASSFVFLFNLPPTQERLANIGNSLSDQLGLSTSSTRGRSFFDEIGEVLARTTAPYLKINVETEITNLLNATGGVDTAGADVDLDTGELTASNVVYDVLPGDNVTVSSGQSPTISVDVPDAGVGSITGTSGRITVSGTTNPTVNIATTYAGQTSITTLGTVGAGTWNGTSLSDAFVDNNLTIGATGSVTWSALTSYPATCGAGSFVRTIGDSLTCAADVGGSSTLQNVYDNGNTLTTTDARDIEFNLADTATDSDFIVDILGTGNIFEVRDGGTPFLTAANGQTTLGTATSSTGALYAAGAPFTTTVSETLTTVDSVDTAGSYTSIAIGTDGLPVVSYYYVAFISGIRVAKCNDVACAGSDETTTAVDAGAPYFTSIAIGTDGLPVISYYDAPTTSLKVAKCNDTACAGSDETITVVDNSADVGQYTSIAIGTDGLPVISYYDDTADSLKVAKCNDVACAGSDETLTTVDDPANDVGQYTSIAIGTDGLPVISYLDATAGDLKVAKCNDAACAGSDETITTVDNSAFVGQYTSIAIGTDGLPVISYFSVSGTSLKVAKCNDTACAGSDETLTTVDNSASVGSYTSIAIGTDGLPVISYYDATAGALKVAHCATAACDSASGTAATAGIDIGSQNLGFRNLYGLAGSFAGSLYVGTSPTGVDNTLMGTNVPFSEGNLTVSGEISAFDTLTVSGVITDAIDASDTQITNALNAGGNFVLLDGARVFSASSGNFTAETTGGTDIISATTADFKINLDDTTTYTESLCHSGADAATGIVDIGDCEVSGGGSDIAEYFGTDGSLEAGDIVVIDESKPAQQIDDEVIGPTSKAWVEASVDSYDPQIIGIVSTNPNLTLAEGVFSDEENPAPVALSGRVPVKVSDENGSISPGDSLTTSSIPGVTMKATKSGPIVGKALESFGCGGSSSETQNSNLSTQTSCVGKILVFVSIGWYVAPLDSNNALQIAGVDNLALSSLTTNSIILGENQITLDQAGDILVDGNLAIAGDLRLTGNLALDGTLLAETVETDNLRIATGDRPTTGTGTIQVGHLEVKIDSQAITAASKIFVTPTTHTGGQALIVSEKKEGKYFIVEVETPHSQAIKFDWWIVN